MCYTFNNYLQTMEKNPDPLNLTQATNPKKPKSNFFSTFFTFRTSETTSYTENAHDSNPQIKKVDGCGKKSGLQLIIDNQKLNNLFPKHMRSKGYFVFITVPGVVTSKIPFYVDPEFDGEHNFYIHGIHVVGVSLAEISFLRH